MNFAAVVAHDKNRLIGGNGKILWHLPEDLKNFKKLTLNSVVIMGRKTFESIGKPLPKRLNVVLTKDKDFRPNNCIVYDDIREVIRDFAEEYQVFVIGGGEIYKKLIGLAVKIELTLIKKDFEGDAFFPEIDSNWTVENIENHSCDEFEFSYITYIRK